MAEPPLPRPWAWSATPPEPPPIRWLARTERWVRAGRPDGRGPGIPARIVGVALLIGRGLAAAISVVLFSVVAVVGILVPWAIQRLLLIDPLGGQRERGTRWIARRATAEDPTHPWTTDPARRPPRPFRRLRVAVALVLVVAATAGWIARREPELRAAAAARAPVPAAYEGEEWWPRLNEEMVFLATSTAYNPYDWQRTADIDLEHFDVVDGVRETWRPPPCDCPTVRLWMYGGSTTFGLGQRDEHTIASELSRAAWADGVRLEVENHGVLGDLHWEASRRFGLDVTLAPPPDVALFYDGVNEIAGADMRNGARDNDDPQPISIALDDARRSHGGSDIVIGSREAPPPEGGSVAEDEPTELYDEAGVAQRAIDDYERARESTRAVAAAHGVEAVFAWSPARATRPVEPDEPQLPPGNEQSVRRTWAEVAARLPVDVIDLIDALDEVDGPLFYDDVHHNEVAAEVLGVRLYRALGADIARAAEAAG